jgi:DNA-binding response OmpR family regulator
VRLLVVEDERKVADALRQGLESEQYAVVVERTGDGGYARAQADVFDLILLDLGLPGRSGLDVLRALRAGGVGTPVIVLTARDAVSERVAGLDAGADDYVVKPFAFAELLARIRALVRRGHGGAAGVFVVRTLALDAIQRRVTQHGRPVELTVREFDLLRHLMTFAGQVVSREALAREVWKESGRTTSLDNVIDAHMTRLRRKIDPDEHLIHTIRGVGFMLADGPP